MKVVFADHFIRQFEHLSEKVQKDFGKQLSHLLRNIRYPSLRAKKYDESQDIWQARVDGSFRFYFQIKKDIYILLEITPHPK